MRWGVCVCVCVWSVEVYLSHISDNGAAFILGIVKICGWCLFCRPEKRWNKPIWKVLTEVIRTNRLSLRPCFTITYHLEYTFFKINSVDYQKLEIFYLFYRNQLRKSTNETSVLTGSDFARAKEKILLITSIWKDHFEGTLASENFLEKAWWISFLCYLLLAFSNPDKKIRYDNSSTVSEWMLI